MGSACLGSVTAVGFVTALQQANSEQAAQIDWQQFPHPIDALCRETVVCITPGH